MDIKFKIKEIINENELFFSRINKYTWGKWFTSPENGQSYAVLPIAIYNIAHEYIYRGTYGIALEKTSFSDAIEQIKITINKDDNKVFIGLCPKFPVIFDDNEFNLIKSNETPCTSDNLIKSAISSYIGDVSEFYRNILTGNGIEVKYVSA